MNNGQRGRPPLGREPGFRGDPKIAWDGRGRAPYRLSEIFRENREHRRRMKELGKEFQPPKKYIVLILLWLNAAIAASWYVSYEIVGVVYRFWFPEYEHPVARQYLVVLLTLVLLFAGAGAIRIFFAPVRRQMEWFVQMIGAMKQLSKGNFNVNLKADARYAGQFGPFVRSFNEMVSELNHMEQVRQEFISNVSHELQSPLTSIAGFARALREDDIPPETRKHYLEIVETESKRLSRMSDNLLKLTSLESNRHPFDKKKYRLDRQLRHLILACEPLWHSKNLEMDVDLPECAIVADEDLMSQVWINLLHNAIKFAPESGTVGVAIRKSNDRVRVLVTDDGPGLSPEALSRVFERFYKEDKARDRSVGGSGLGLSIVKKIVVMHGGDAFADNRPEGGASFAVELPLP